MNGIKLSELIKTLKEKLERDGDCWIMSNKTMNKDGVLNWFNHKSEDRLNKDGSKKDATLSEFRNFCKFNSLEKYVKNEPEFIFGPRRIKVKTIDQIKELMPLVNTRGRLNSSGEFFHDVMMAQCGETINAREIINSPYKYICDSGWRWKKEWIDECEEEEVAVNYALLMRENGEI